MIQNGDRYRPLSGVSCESLKKLFENRDATKHDTNHHAILDQEGAIVLTLHGIHGIMDKQGNRVLVRLYVF